MAKAGIPDTMQTSRTKPQIALDEIDRLIAAGIRFGTVLADAGYGLSATFRQGLSGRGLTWAVGIPKHQKLYPHDLELTFPVSGHGRPRKHRSQIRCRLLPKRCWRLPIGKRSVGAVAQKAA